MRTNLVLQWLSLCPRCLPSVLTHTHTRTVMSPLCPTCPFLHAYLLSSIYSSVFYSCYGFLHPSPPLSYSSFSSTTLFCQSHFLSFSVILFFTPLFLFSLHPSRPPLFIQPHSIPPFIPRTFHLLLPADDAWCDGDWLRESQRERTAGRG